MLAMTGSKGLHGEINDGSRIGVQMCLANAEQDMGFVATSAVDVQEAMGYAMI
jgi:hypothetical protein